MAGLTIRRRVILCLLTWLTYSCIHIWVVLHEWWQIAPFTGFFGMTVAYSICMKLVTGKWPNWKGTWKLLRHGWKD